MVRKIPSGVGPRFPQVVVLFGATGDLAHRKLLPGLFRLSAIGFIPECRIIGVSLEDLDADGFRKIARAALRTPRLRAAERGRSRPAGGRREG
jgi:glucose-6-phosphate 1-dehydrogenase